MRSFAAADDAASWAEGLLWAMALCCVASILSRLFQLQIILRAATEHVARADLAASFWREVLIARFNWLVSLATGVAFLMWFHRVHSNLPSLGGRGFKYSPGWAVGSFLVPILCLFRPPEIMREVWHGSEPAGLERDLGPDGPSLRNELGVPGLVGVWWALYLLLTVVGNLILRLVSWAQPTLESLLGRCIIAMGVDAVEIAAALVAVRLVNRITSAQRERRVQLSALTAAG